MTFIIPPTSPGVRNLLHVLVFLQVLAMGSALIAGEPVFRAGFSQRDITPQAPMPMWGYGDRHDKLSTGIIHPLHAKAIVIHAGKEKLALVGLDLGRGPTRSMTNSIRQAIRERAGIEHLMISGSHTHHGPCIELLDHSGFGKDKFPAAVAYNLKLSGWLVEAILEADQNAIPARIGVSTRKVNLNRNRHSKRSPKAVDPMLSVIRLDAHEGDREGQPIAVLVNYAAHPTMTDSQQLKFSADYPGFLQDKVEHDLDTGCLFMQGAAGDMSVNPPSGVHGPQAYGELLAAEVIEMASTTQGKVPQKPSLRGRVDHFHFKSRVDFTSPLIAYSYGEAFYTELIRCFTKELQAGIPPELNTVVLNGQLALVGGSGEFFCNHANRLKARSYLPHTLFFGYCNDHYLYFPTIEAVSEGGYGADPPVSPVEVGAGEQMMNQALKNIYTLVGKIAPEKNTSDKP